MPALLRRSRHHRTNGRSRGGRKCRWLDLEIPAAASRVAGFNGHRWPAGKIRVQLHFCHLLAYQSVALAEPLPPLELLPPDYSATNQKLHGQITHLISSAIIDHTPVPLERNLATSHVLYPKKKKIQTSSFSDATEGVVFAVGTEKKTSVPRTRSRISGIEPAAHFSVDLTRSFKERGDGGVILVAFSLSHHPLNKT